MKFTRLTGHIGADVHAVDLSQPLRHDEIEEIRLGLIEHLVLFFREQKLMTVEQHKALASNFGDLETTTYRREGVDEKVNMVLGGEPGMEHSTSRPSYHADGTFKADPAMASFLQAHVLPEFGGGTGFVSMYAAYEALSPSFRSYLDTLDAYHSLAHMNRRHWGKPGYDLRISFDDNPPMRSPLVRVHPDTGRKFLNVNSVYTSHVADVRDDESEMLLKFLFDHVARPEFQVRLNWNVGDVAYWDNWSTQHFGVPDYEGRRLLKRISVIRRAADRQQAA